MPIDYEAIKRKLLEESIDPDETNTQPRNAIASLIPMAAGVLTGQTSEGAALGLKSYQTLEDQRQKSRAKLLDYLSKMSKDDPPKESVSWQKEVDDSGVLRNIAYKVKGGDVIGKQAMGETVTPVSQTMEGVMPNPLLSRLAREGKPAQPFTKEQGNFQKTVSTSNGVFLITTDASGKELAREKIGEPIVRDYGTDDRANKQKQMQYASDMKEIEQYDSVVNNLVSYIEKRKGNDLPGVGFGKETASGFTGYPIVGGIASKVAGEETEEDKSFVNNLRNFIRQESLLTGGKALTDNEKQMVKEAIGLMNSGDPAKVRLGIIQARDIFNNVKARIKSGYDPEKVVSPVEQRYESYKSKAQGSTTQDKKARLLELRKKYGR